MTISFAPLSYDAVHFLIDRTGIDYRHCDFTSPHWFCCTARNDEGTVRGVFIGEFTTWFECHISTAVDDPAILSRRLLRVLFGTLFSRAVRITALTRPDNERSISGIKRLGFYQEGFMRLAIEGKWDANLYGMLRHECRFLPGYVPPEQSLPYLRNGRSVEPISGGNFAGGPSGFANGNHILGSDFRPSVALSLEVGPVQVPVGHVLRRGGPSEMSPIDASADAAVMGGLMSGRGGGSVGNLTEQTGQAVVPVVVFPDRIAVPVHPKRPEDAFPSSVQEGAQNEIETVICGHWTEGKYSSSSPASEGQI